MIALEGSVVGVAAAGRYPDVGDNVHANVCDWLDSNCGQSENKWFIPGTCKNGHRHIKVIYCGKEWCPVCGQVGSDAHNRRYVRWFSKIKQFKSMRYLVLTIPENIRYKFRTKISLTELGRMAQFMMIKHGYRRGLRRWHWFGDESTKYNPHLNIMIDGAYMKPCEIMILRAEWADILNIKFSDSNVFTEYKRLPSDMAGCLRYVTRSTFLDYNYDLEMAIELRNFRNMVTWGRDWKNEPSWDIDKIERTNATGQPLDIAAIEHLINRECPICHLPIMWKKPLPERLLSLVDTIDIGAGFKYVLDNSPPGYRDSKIDENLHKMKMIMILKSLGAIEPKDIRPKRYLRYINGKGQWCDN